jgi:hypothetical protein
MPRGLELYRLSREQQSTSIICAYRCMLSHQSLSLSVAHPARLILEARCVAPQRLCPRDLPRRAVESRVGNRRSLYNLHREIADDDRGWGVTPIRNYGAAGVARHALAALWVGHVGAAFWEEVAHVPVEVLVLNAAGEDKISARAVRPPRAWGQNRQVDRQAFSRTTQSVRQASCSS